MDNRDLERYFTKSTVIQDSTEEPEVLMSLAGYQVTKGEFFAHSREPSVTIWENRVKFNMACLRRFPGVTHIQILIHPEQKRLIIRPCSPDAPDALRWAKGGGEKDLSNRNLLCKIFAAKVFDLMGWDAQYHYKMLGTPAVYEGEAVPEVLLSGNHEKIRRWRLRESLRRTLERRPDLFADRVLTREEEEILKELKSSFFPCTMDKGIK